VRDAPNRIGNASPIIPFTFGNERVERCENLLFAESRHEIFQILFDFSSYRRSQFWIDIEFSRAPAALREFHASWRA
jgi:hypothetical protein